MLLARYVHRIMQHNFALMYLNYFHEQNRGVEGKAQYLILLNSGLISGATTFQ